MPEPLATSPNIVITNQGVFVPQTVFGLGVQIVPSIKHRPDGTVEVHLQGLLPVPHSQLNGEAERHWVAEYGSEYAGQWVALDGGRLLAHGMSPRQVYIAAQAAGVAVPSLVQVPTKPEVPFAGW